MPNHTHGIIATVGVPLVGTRKTVGNSSKRAGTRPAPTGLGDIVGAFKSITTHEYIRGVKLVLIFLLNSYLLFFGRNNNW